MEARIKGSNKDFQPVSFVTLGDDISTCYKPKDLEFKTDSEFKDSVKDLHNKFYLARDKDGDLYLHLTEPYKNDEVFCSNNDETYIRPDHDDFGDITFENSPVKVKLSYETNQD